MIVLIAATNTVKNGDALRSRAILKHNVSPGWPRGANQPFKLDGSDFAEFLAGTTFALQEIDAVLTVNDWYIGHSLGKGGVYSLPLTHTSLKLAVYFVRALRLADTTTGALIFVNIP